MVKIKTGKMFLRILTFIYSRVAALVERHPQDPYAALAYSRLALEAGNRELALAQAERALTLKPRWQEARLQRAQVLIALDKIEPALQDLGAAVAEDVANRTLRLAYARLLVKTRRLDAAQDQYEILLRQSSKDADVLYALSLLTMEAERFDKAQRYLRRLIATGQRVDEAHYYLGLIAERRGDTDEALQELVQVGEGEFYLNALIKRLNLLAGEGRVDEVRSELERLRGSNPELAVRLYLIEGDLLQQHERADQAMALYTRALGEYPDDADLLYARGLLAESLDRLDLAEADLRRILAGDPENAQALNALGYTLADRTDRYAEAHELIRRAYAQRPDDAAVIDSMGWVLYRLGKLDEAVEYLRRAYELVQDPEIAAHLGEVLWANGQKEAARQIWEEGRKADPKDATLMETLKRLQP